MERMLHIVLLFNFSITQLLLDTTLKKKLGLYVISPKF